ncbi:hypothetical protein Tco_1095919 [Tanacetum coccineum]
MGTNGPSSKVFRRNICDMRPSSRIKKLREVLINNTLTYIGCRYSVGSVIRRHRVNPIRIRVTRPPELVLSGGGIGGTVPDMIES